MSAFVVGKAHIDAMVTTAFASQSNPLYWRAGDGWRNTRETTPDAVGAMLLAECVASVRYRYDDAGDDLPGPLSRYWLEPYTHNGLWRYHGYNAVQMLKAIACYEYQSCEHPGWESSEARAFCESLRLHLINKLPGYEDAAWEIVEKPGVNR